MTFENQLKDAAKREKELARQLLVQEAGGDRSAQGMVDAIERVFGRLYRNMLGLIGLDGFDVLVKRALYLARLEFPFVVSVTVQCLPDQCRFDGLAAAVLGRPPTEVDEATSAILGYFFWLIVTFVGDNLFYRLIGGAWPGFTIEEKEPGSEETQG